MDCETARLFLPFVTPSGKDLDGPEADKLHAHLEQCTACNALSMNANRVDQHLGRAMRAVPVPAGMKERILARLAEDRGVIRRRWLKRAGQHAALVACVAAVLVLAVWASFVGPNRKPAEVDPNDVLAPVAVSGHDQESVQRAFAALGSRAVAPNYRYEFLVGEPTMAVLPGHPKYKVPQLVFVDPPPRPWQQLREEEAGRKKGLDVRPPTRRAIVYVLPARKNGLEPPYAVKPSSVPFREEYKYNVKVDDEASPGCTCLVLYDGESCGWLKAPRND